MVLGPIGVTGASGMLGRHFIEAAGRRGLECLATSRTRPVSVPDGTAWQQCDLGMPNLTPAVLDAIMPGANAVVHIAAASPSGLVSPSEDQILKVNVGATLGIGIWARLRQIPLVFVSGATVYADPHASQISESDGKIDGLAFGGFYGLSKYLGELVLRNEAARGLHLTVLRPSSIYGIGLPPTKLIHSMWMKAVAGDRLIIDEPVEDSINFVHASDVANAALDAYVRGVSGTFNLAGENINMKDLAQLCQRISGRGLLEIGRGSGRPPFRRFDLDDKAAAAELRYRPSVTVEDYYEWLSRNGGDPTRIPASVTPDEVHASVPGSAIRVEDQRP